jgi:hypothetical protein
MMARFLAYSEKVFGLSDQVAQLKDGREAPRIPTGAAFASVFSLFATQRKSLHAADQERRLSSHWRKLIGDHAPSEDTVGRVFALLDSQGLRAMLHHINDRLKRNKALPTASGYRFAAVDGHEFFSQSQALLPAVSNADAARGG